MGINESHISERLKKLKNAGFLDDQWVKMETREGYKNVKQYYFKSDKIVLTFTPSGMEVKASGREEEKMDITIPFYRSEIPHISSFVGRDVELSFLKNTPGIKVVWGIAGIGKTTLVSRFASDVVKTPVFWHQVKQVDGLSYLITKLAVFLNMQGRKGLLDLINKGVKDRSVLIDAAIKEMSKSSSIFIFDDFQRCMDRGIVELLQSMAEKGIDGVVISRQRLSLSGSKDLKVEGLSVDESAALMKICGRNPLHEIITKTKGHPLLIDLACRVQNFNTDDYIKETILGSLNEDELSILLPISVYRGKISLPAVEAVVKHIKGGTIINFIMSMEKLGIITVVGNEFELHPLIRDVACNLLYQPDELHGRAGNFYYKKGGTQDRLESLFHFIIGKKSEMAIEVLSQFASFIDEGYGDVLINLLDHLPAINDTRLSAWILLTEGSTMRSLSSGMDTAKERLMEAIKCADESADKRAKAMALNNLGIIYKELGEVELSRKYYQEAIKSGNLDSLVVSRIIYNIAEVDLEEGEFTRAFEGMEKSLKIDLKHHEMRGYYVSRLNIDYIKFLLGQFDDALNDLKDAAEKLGKLGFKSLLGYCYLHMAYTVVAMDGSLSEALNYLGLAIEQYTLSGFKYMLAYTLAERIIVEVKLRKIEDAQSDLNMIEKIMGKIEDKDVLGVVELARAVFFISIRKFPEGEEHLNNSIKLLSRDWISNIRVMSWRGVLEHLYNKNDLSKEYLTKAHDRLLEKGCNAFATRIEKCMNELETGEWESLCKFII